jgi:DNA-binding NtrC family response regulator
VPLPHGWDRSSRAGNTESSDADKIFAASIGGAEHGETTRGSVFPGVSLHDRLKALGPERLAQLLLSIVELDEPHVRRLVEEALETRSDTKGQSGGDGSEPYMVGASPAMQRVFAAIRKFADTNAPLLITGESGTGKELAARAVHERSAYGKGPFVAINCAALPPTLVAAELFGYEKGAFTGANTRRIGRLESAQGGTIFLDEIGDLPLEQQAHLLRFLQEKTIDRVGGTRPVTVEARVIVATNVDLRSAVKGKRFREDLFYRLNVLALHLPSMRERGTDLDLLATFFLRKFAEEHGRLVAGFSDDAWEKMRGYSWPGNVRELIGCLRRAVVMAEKPWITATDLGLDESPSLVTQDLTDRGDRSSAIVPRRAGIDEAMLRTALSEHGGNVTSVARALEVSRMTVYRLMQRFGIQ